MKKWVVLSHKTSTQICPVVFFLPFGKSSRTGEPRGTTVVFSGALFRSNSIMTCFQALMRKGGLYAKLVMTLGRWWIFHIFPTVGPGGSSKISKKFGTNQNLTPGPLVAKKEAWHSRSVVLVYQMSLVGGDWNIFSFSIYL